MFGSDLVLETLDRLGVDHLALNPGATLRGIHESLLNAPRSPHGVLALHENVAVGIAHGYAKAAGRPMAVGLHDTVGLLDGSMALFNAWVDRAPMLVLVGAGPLDAELRRPWIDWVHTAGDQGELVRRFSVWNDQPHSLPALIASLAQGWNAARGPVGGPAIISVDLALQELTVEAAVPDLGAADPLRAGPDPAAISAAAALLRASRRPLLVADRPMSDEASGALVALTQSIGAGMYEAGGGGNVPVGHPLDLTDVPDLAARADLLVCVDVRDVAFVRQRIGTTRDIPVIAIGVAPLRDRSWMPLAAPSLRGLEIAGEPGLCLSAIRDAAPSDRRRRWDPEGGLIKSMTASTDLSAAVLAAETAAACAGNEVVVAHGALDGWVRRSFRLQSPSQFLGRSGGEGLGYALPATLGAALAHRGTDRLVIGFQTDGDLLYVPQALWTAAHERLPALMVVADNRGYQRDAYHQRLTASARGRDPTAAAAGVAIEQPRVDIAALARTFGVEARGPVSDLATLRTALRDGARAVRGGEPFLIDVETL